MIYPLALVNSHELFFDGIFKGDFARLRDVSVIGEMFINCMLCP